MAEHSAHNWIAGAVEHPGALTAKAKAAGESLSVFERQHHNDPTTRRQVALAKTFKKIRKGR